MYYCVVKRMQKQAETSKHKTHLKKKKKSQLFHVQIPWEKVEGTN